MLKKLTTVCVVFASMFGAMAEVPSLINYQGKLSDNDGAPVTGYKNFTLRIFDANEGGNQVYEEEIGTVSVKDGLYSFGFGEAGQSILDFSESLVVQEEGKQIFDFTLGKTPVEGSLSVTAGQWTWGETGGSSNSGELIVNYDKTNKSAKIIFLNSSPKKDAALKFDYRIKVVGILGSLSSAKSSWLEITVGGETLSPRERLVSVPFALKAKQLISPIELPLLIESYHIRGRHIGTLHTRSDVNIFAPEGPGFRQFSSPFSMQYFFVPKGISKLKIQFYNLGIAGGANSQNIRENMWKGYGLILPLNTEEVTYIENPEGGEDTYTRYNLTVINNVKEGLYRVDAVMKGIFYDIDNVSSGNKTALSGAYGIVITGEQ
jgi:hypothetical protein